MGKEPRKIELPGNLAEEVTLVRSPGGWNRLVL